MDLNEIKEKNSKLINKSKETSTESEYIISFLAIHERPTQNKKLVEDTIVIKIEPYKDGKEMLLNIKKAVNKEKFKDTRVENLKKFILINLTKI